VVSEQAGPVEGGSLERSSGPRGWLADARRVDQAVYIAIAETPTPALDVGMRRLSHAADKSRLWISAATVLAAVAGRPGRRAAAQGLVSVAVSSAVVNLGIKHVAGRRRPDREGALVPQGRHVPMPTSLSFPSGHSASAFGFATGVANQLPVVAAPLYGLAGVVAYSRVHTGVHYPGDIIVGALLGTVIAQLTTHVMDRYVVRSA
jgi:membrane-associated phospholipid phosphatase